MPAGKLPNSLGWIESWIGSAITIDRPEILWRASGLRRPGLTVQLAAPRLSTRIGLGVETALAHAIVDSLLRFERRRAETALQLTPVEWGIWSFLVLRVLDVLGSPSDRSEALTPADLSLDRASPDPFDPEGLGAIVTIRWAVRIGDRPASSLRIWVPETVIHGWLTAGPRQSPSSNAGNEILPLSAKHARLAGVWRACAGAITLPRGTARLRVGTVLPLTETTLAGTPTSPVGSVELLLDLSGQPGRFRIPARAVDSSGGRLLQVEGPPAYTVHLRQPIEFDFAIRTEKSAMNSSDAPTLSPSASPVEVPVTLTVELGRVNLTLAQLADIKPGDVIELSRHSRAPVELTSNGRLVARGDLILIDTDLGVRITGVFV
jgi:flagellar motor switch protein FliN